MKRSHTDPLDHLRLLLPEGKDLFSIKEVAKIINKSPQFTRDAFKNGKLLGYALKGRSLNKPQKRNAYLIHRDDIIIYLLKHANHPPHEFRNRIVELLTKGSKSQLEFFQEIIKNKLQELSEESTTICLDNLTNDNI